MFRSGLLAKLRTSPRINTSRAQIVRFGDYLKDFYIYMSDLIDEKNNNPKNDMISRLSQVSENNQQLTKDQIICTVIYF